MVKFYYNGVLLPEIPQDVLAEYPYCWIRTNSSSGYYDLIMSSISFKYDKNDQGINNGRDDYDKWYRIAIQNSNSAIDWGVPQSHTYTGWGIDTSRPVLWSNHDIYSTDSTLYMQSFRPVPENIPIILTGDKYYYNNMCLPELPRELLEYYPHMFIRFDTVDSVYEAFYSQTEWVALNTDSLQTTSMGGICSYRLPIDWQATDENWTFDGMKKDYTTYTNNYSKMCIWCYPTIDSVLDASEPVSGDNMTQNYQIERYMIERLATQIRRITKKIDTFTFDDIIDALKAK